MSAIGPLIVTVHSVTETLNLHIHTPAFSQHDKCAQFTYVQLPAYLLTVKKETSIVNINLCPDHKYPEEKGG